MIEFLLTFSLLLHGIVFIIIIFLFKRIDLQKSANQNKEDIREIEDMLFAYVEEIKEENQKLLNIINENGKNVKDEKQVEQKKHQQALASTTNTQTQSANIQADELEQKEETNGYNPENIMIDDQLEIQTSESKVLQLYHRGLSVEEIAKELNIGKTEVELMIKFQNPS
ncbi:DUF6115 domain-containing protein [Salinibacillus xinjiangensis]|uniref:Uncharacterized protein n=1 Tax=Salinibacillus xinjiangensis TaxID=1229268 RepID=A0A6G1X352_9BACI|nr:hypothetical protein [Salinibacillus xinjiangensis]MRG85372.1 hypothetical protein [Salinibacillus xinjiangensis]